MPHKLYHTTRQEKYLWHLTMSYASFMLGSKIAIGSLVFEILVLEKFRKIVSIQFFSSIVLVSKWHFKVLYFIMALQILFLFHQFWWSSVGMRIFLLLIITIFLTLEEVIRTWDFDRIFFGNQARKVTQTQLQVFVLTFFKAWVVGVICSLLSCVMQVSFFVHNLYVMKFSVFFKFIVMT